MRQIDRESRLRSSSDPPESWLSVAMRGLFIVYELLDLEQYLFCPFLGVTIKLDFVILCSYRRLTHRHAEHIAFAYVRSNKKTTSSRR